MLLHVCVSLCVCVWVSCVWSRWGLSEGEVEQISNINQTWQWNSLTALEMLHFPGKNVTCSSIPLTVHAFPTKNTWTAGNLRLTLPLVTRLVRHWYNSDDLKWSLEPHNIQPFNPKHVKVDCRDFMLGKFLLSSLVLPGECLWSPKNALTSLLAFCQIWKVGSS